MSYPIVLLLPTKSSSVGSLPHGVRVIRAEPMETEDQPSAGTELTWQMICLTELLDESLDACIEDLASIAGAAGGVVLVGPRRDLIDRRPLSSDDREGTPDPGPIWEHLPIPQTAGASYQTPMFPQPDVIEDALNPLDSESPSDAQRVGTWELLVEAVRIATHTTGGRATLALSAGAAAWSNSMELSGLDLAVAMCAVGCLTTGTAMRAALGPARAPAGLMIAATAIALVNAIHGVYGAVSVDSSIAFLFWPLIWLVIVLLTPVAALLWFGDGLRVALVWGVTEAAKRIPMMVVIELFTGLLLGAAGGLVLLVSGDGWSSPSVPVLAVLGVIGGAVSAVLALQLALVGRAASVRYDMIGSNSVVNPGDGNGQSG